MSELTQAECVAGVSRKALETLRRNGSSGNGSKPASPPPTKTAYDIITAYRETRVLDTPMRKLGVLESHDGRVIIRSTEYGGNRADVVMLHLEYHEAQALAAALHGLEPNEGAPAARRARA